LAPRQQRIDSVDPDLHYSALARCNVTFIATFIAPASLLFRLITAPPKTNPFTTIEPFTTMSIADNLWYEQQILANCTQLFPGKSPQILTAITDGLNNCLFIVCAATGELLYQGPNDSAYHLLQVHRDLMSRMTDKVADIRAGRAVTSVVVPSSAELAEMKAEMETMRQQVEDLKRENASLAGRCGEAEGFKREIEGWKNEVAGWKREVEGWRAENEGLKRELADARGERYTRVPPQESVWSEDFGTPIATPCAVSEAGDDDGCSPWLEVRTESTMSPRVT
jgi:hypothetical protein